MQFRPAAAVELDRAAPSTWRIIVERLEQERTPETRQLRVEHIVERLAENGRGASEEEVSGCLM